MFGHGGSVKVFVATRPVDFRKGIDGLALAVQEMFGMDPFCGAAFVFRAKRADRIKLLIWDQTGMVLVHKRLEGGKFVWPQVRDGVMRLFAGTWGCERGFHVAQFACKLHNLRFAMGCYQAAHSQHSFISIDASCLAKHKPGTIR